MEGTIYLIGKDGELQAMAQEPYDSENLLQEYLARYPHLLAGDQINSEFPRKWLLVSREMSVPGEEEGSGRWSLDHLFLDQDGVPTLVEIKRSTDTRSRREVVAQMLDYAANAVLYWSPVQIRSCFEMNCQTQGVEPSEEVLDLLGSTDETEVENYWDKVKTNLLAEKIRLIFIADQIPPELKRIVEFLNGQMNPAEVLAIQIPQFVGQGQKALVPTVLGLTTKAAAVKNKRPVRGQKAWDETSFFEAVKAVDPDALEPARMILEWALTHGFVVRWAGGPVMGNFRVSVNKEGTDVKLLHVEVSANSKYPKYAVRAYIHIGILRKFPPFDDKVHLLALLDRFNQISGVSINPELVDDETPRFPSVPVTILREPQGIKQFLDALEWARQQIESA